MKYLILSVILFVVTPSYPQVLAYSYTKKSYFRTLLCLGDSSKFVYAEVWPGHAPNEYYERGHYETVGDTLLLHVTNVGLDNVMISSFRKKALKQGKHLLLLRDDNTVHLQMRKKRLSESKCKLAM